MEGVCRYFSNFSIIRECSRFYTKIYTALIWQCVRSEFGRAHLGTHGLKMIDKITEFLDGSAEMKNKFA